MLASAAKNSVSRPRLIKPGGGEPRQQQQPEPARDAAARVHQHHDEQDVGADLQAQLQVKIAARRDQQETQRAEQHDSPR